MACANDNGLAVTLSEPKSAIEGYKWGDRKIGNEKVLSTDGKIISIQIPKSQTV